MILTSIYARPDRCAVLWRLLAERPYDIGISHKEMPTWAEHVKFVEGKPYADWCFIGKEPKGSVYLTRANEIGVFIFKEFQGNGIGAQAINAIMAKHGQRRYLANIAPGNEQSIKVFSNLGFRLIQHTYEVTSE